MTYLSLAALLFLLACVLLHLIPVLALYVLFARLWPPPGGRRRLSLWQAAALCALWLYPVNVLDIAAAALAIWAAMAAG